MAISTETFYSDLPIQDIRLSELIADKSLFVTVPEDWYVLVADIENSSQAIQAGRHQDVNLIATGSVIAILNLAAKANISIPFFFGGDGAVMLVPEKLLESGILALTKHRENTAKNFGFNLKIGHISVSEIYKNKVELIISKAKISDIFSIPVVLGNGLQYAENHIKQEETTHFNNFPEDQSPLNLDGMECKWNKIKPPEEGQEVISLIVSGCGSQEPSKIFSQVLNAIDDIYGSPKRRKPISVKHLELNQEPRLLNSEMKVKLGGYNSSYFIKNWLKTRFGDIYLKHSEAGKAYLEKLVELTDTLTIDGRINTVISGTPKQREALISFLDELEKSNKIKYGLHVSNASVMSCYVKDMSTDEHIHFVDGADGGYTKAANNLKEKFFGMQPL